MEPAEKKKRVVFHVDMDAFFASCEEAINPKLKLKPLIVGGLKTDTRSIVSCPNYLARKRGVKTAMPITRALQLVPEANFIRGTRGLYSDVSKKVRGIFGKYTPLVQPVSVDEAYLDVTGVLFGYENDAQKLARIIKEEIKSTLDITCSIGISGSKLCSKIASDFNKPDGITYVPPGKEKDFLSELEVKRIPGVGKNMQAKLKKYGINLIKDILKYEKSFYENEIGMHSAYLLRVANGIDNREVNPERDERKSISKETTFSFDTNDIEYLKKKLYSLLERICAKMRKDKIKARTVTVKAKYYDFKINQKSFTRSGYSNLEPDFYEDTVTLLEKLLTKGKKLRLLGVRFNEFIEEDNSIQENLFHDNDKFKSISEKLDKLREKYNPDVIKFGKNF